jgi:hypothetical protein
LCVYCTADLAINGCRGLDGSTDIGINTEAAADSRGRCGKANGSYASHDRGQKFGLKLFGLVDHL